jgi:hypothetical protein
VKKLRGGRRYYERLRKRAREFSIDLRSDQWFDLWHEHFDWHGVSRRGGRHRAEHLRAAFVAFKRVVNQCIASDRPVQVFVSIAPASEAYQDALYVHTPNPNGTPFPHVFEGIWCGVVPPALVRDFVQSEPWDTGAFTSDNLSGNDARYRVCTNPDVLTDTWPPEHGWGP